MGENPLIFGLGLVIHHIGLHRFHAQRDGGQRIGHKVDPQKLHGQKGRFMPQDHGEKHGKHFADIGPQQEPHDFPDIGVNPPTFPHSIHNGGEIVVGKCHVRRALGYVGAGNAHSAADVRGFQSGSVVYAVAGHGNHLALALPRFYNAYLIFGGHPGIHRDVGHFLIQLAIGHGVQLGAGNGFIPLL